MVVSFISRGRGPLLERGGVDPGGRADGRGEGAVLAFGTVAEMDGSLVRKELLTKRKKRIMMYKKKSGGSQMDTKEFTKSHTLRSLVWKI